MEKQISLKKITLTFSILIIGFLVVFYILAWQAPSQPPPAGNVAEPINAGTEPQQKLGRITAAKFCGYPPNDSYCFDPAGNSKIDSITIIGSTISLDDIPCNSSFRGKMYLLQGGAGDALYICQKDEYDDYDWVALLDNYTTLANYAPVLSSVGDSPNEVVIGQTITFTVWWSDVDDGDLTKIHICRIDSIGGDQQCGSGTLCDSANFSDSSPTSCQYATGIEDLMSPESNTYYAFVCDDDNACSDSQSGSYIVYPIY